MSQFSFVEAIRRLNEIGMLDLILPFLLFFTIIFAALQKTMILARRKRDGSVDNADEVKKYNLVIALVIALLAVIPHVVFNDGDLTNGRLGGPLMGLPNVVEIINNSLPSVAVWIIAILMLLLLVGLFGFSENVFDNWKKWIAGVAIIVVAYIFISAAGYLQTLPQSLRFLQDPVNQAVLLILLIFGLIIWFIVGGKKPEPAESGGGESGGEGGEQQQRRV
ncbi:hypothetical protein KY336_01360 [Candidatus Woesearchaeota archaeon]|nr:hypothetical protein [Candidatus Woesearchaeota archaeon]